MLEEMINKIMTDPTLVKVGIILAIIISPALFKKLFKVVMILKRVVPIILPILANHRGWNHVQMPAVLLPLPLLLIPKVAMEGTLIEGLPYCFDGVTRYFSHLFNDRNWYELFLTIHIT